MNNHIELLEKKISNLENKIKRVKQSTLPESREYNCIMNNLREDELILEGLKKALKISKQTI